ncbi:hypothetical protein PHYBLDRAFT_145747 [Phycomyces blakesleeanus NRRL 1555(-)]|uniref:Uncharacterized protein n=1 Tax=Phycomyces blakesleeanus (strain ATCC 8743b / DSM 1359 / FGSC 10004 / NBRC 33097 / NRRL 1555) TaxID=763407 RepID=A0A163DTS7_PHYB8|nr:hypothetical protein PHYBLDRAFT_145747 [Phycomyces blakesleeanus NRRL 1555(-)]OAD73350.1 hypothetical protein PHYBLDRAFT_145747 [Phycomyces blakesleeanus NRRL 1555(-)]|eukprot:XP_018291390.1 hypothetical protein PHYBLDRAFT_145747 [Phycomyces blakesleeanus NRRL 1555(-)]
MIMNRWIPQWPARPSTILRVFYALDLPPSPPHINSYHVLDGVLAAVWKAYWRTIFDNVPFVPINVVVSTGRTILVKTMGERASPKGSTWNCYVYPFQQNWRLRLEMVSK